MKSGTKVIDLPLIVDKTGNLCFMQEPDQIPFAIGTVEWVYGPSDEGPDAALSEPAGEAIIVALAGRLRVAVTVGRDERTFTLDDPYQSLYVPGDRRWALQDRPPTAIGLVIRAAPSSAAASRPGPREGAVVDARTSKVGDCDVVELPRLHSASGQVSSISSGGRRGFEIRRVYHLTNILQGASRGGHAHRELHQYLVAAAGSFEVVIDDGQGTRSIMLTRPDRALHLVPGIWRDLRGFSSGSICLVGASHPFEERDYLRDHDEFLTFKGG